MFLRTTSTARETRPVRPALVSAGPLVSLDGNAAPYSRAAFVVDALNVPGDPRECA
jgi:hypothetical protein